MVQMGRALFNLLDEGWIPALDRPGVRRFVGLREALLAAERIQSLACPSPLAEVAISRLLLAVLHRALRGPRNLYEALEIWESGRFPRDRIESYLDRWADRLYLFHTEHPFYQVADLPTENPTPWTKLLPELASGNNPTLFDHTMDDAPPPASPAEAAVALLVHQAFTPGGLVKKMGATSGSAAPLAATVAFLPQGETLFETLVLNLVDYDPEGDEPIWEREPYRACDLTGGQARATFSGTTRIYTWLSRAVRLLPEEDGTVRFMAYGPGVERNPGAQLDPMCAYRRSKGSFTPYRLREGRAFWRDIEALGTLDEKWRRPAVVERATEILLELNRPATLFPLSVVGQMVDRAKVLDVRREVYSLSPRIKDPAALARVREAVQTAEAVARVLYQAARHLVVSLAPHLEQPAARKGLSDRLRSFPFETRYWSTLQARFPSFLERMAREGEEAAMDGWKEAVREAARDAWELTAATIGTRPAHLRGIADAERILQRGLSSEV